MHARVLAVTMVAVLSLCPLPVFGQCCGSYYMPAVPAYTTYYAPAAPCCDAAPYVAYYAAAGLHDVLCGACTRRTMGRPLRPIPRITRGQAGACSAPRVYVAGQPVRNVFRVFTP